MMRLATVIVTIFTALRPLLERWWIVLALAAFGIVWLHAPWLSVGQVGGIVQKYMALVTTFYLLLIAATTLILDWYFPHLLQYQTHAKPSVLMWGGIMAVVAAVYFSMGALCPQLLVAWCPSMIPYSLRPDYTCVMMRICGAINSICMTYLVYHIYKRAKTVS